MPSRRSGRTRRYLAGCLRFVLVIILVVGVVQASNLRMVSHDAFVVAQIVADHRSQAEEHGHAHDDTGDLVNDDLSNGHHGHHHDEADHDHNITFLPPRASSDILETTGTNWTLLNNGMLDRGEFDLDRPPRA